MVIEEQTLVNSFFRVYVRAMSHAVNPLWNVVVPLPADARATRRLLPYLPQLSLAERDRRWAETRRRMAARGIDVLLLMANDIYWDMGFANLRYLTQCGSKIGSFALFFHDRDPIVWNAVAHMNRPTNLHLSTQEWTTDLRTITGLGSIAAELRDRGLERASVGLVGFSSTIQTTPTLLYGDVRAMEDALPNATFVDVGDMFEQMRLRKSPEELSMLRAAGKIAKKVLDRVFEFARPGVTEAELYAEMIKTQIANGGEPNIFNLFASGPVEHPPQELWHLLHGAEQPLVPTTRPLADGDLVVSEYHTKYGGYLCHTEFTAYIGKQAPQRLKDIFAVCVECLDVSKQELRAGNTFRAAWTAIREPARRAGLDFVELGWHAMGLASPEFPTVIYPEGFGGNALNGTGIGDLVFEEGMTFGNNIDLHDPHWKVDVGCMYSDFMIVGTGEAETCIGVPRELPQLHD
jgi:Xaa-Pro aminopeptidase